MPDMYGIPTLTEFHAAQRKDYLDYEDSIVRMDLLHAQLKQGLLTREGGDCRAR